MLLRFPSGRKHFLTPEIIQCVNKVKDTVQDAHGHNQYVLRHTEHWLLIGPFLNTSETKFGKKKLLGYGIELKIKKKN